MWSDAYLIIVEDNFERIFTEIFEHEFVDKIFGSHETTINLEDFTTSLAGDLDSDARAEWLFTPAKVRNIFQKHIDFEEYIDVIEECI